MIRRTARCRLRIRATAMISQTGVERCETSLDEPSARLNAARVVVDLDLRHEVELLSLLLDLDAASRTNRFGIEASNEILIEHSRRALSASTFIAGIFIEGKLRGVVEAYDSSCGTFSELAFLVERRWRQHGLGRTLLEAARRWAERSHRTTLRMVISRGNLPMRKLAASAGARFGLSPDEIQADICVTPRLSKVAPAATNLDRR
jgi:GNAT superfamily N-acetyltransferase